MVSSIGPEKVGGILFFHAFTGCVKGCNVVSVDRCKGKKSALQTWNVCEDVTETFKKLSNCPQEVSDDDLQKLENFVVLMYDRFSAASCVNEARLDHFAPCPQAQDLRCDSTTRAA